MENRPIIKKVYYAFPIELASPICVSGSDSFYTDNDVIRNGNGELFIPGTSIAGAVKEALGLRENMSGIMGFSKGDEGAMSSLFFSDLYFDENENEEDGKIGPVVGVRDGIQLDAEKKVNNKFDMQMIETGAKGTLYISYLQREKDTYEFEASIKRIILKISSGDIRIGANKNRGFGRLRVNGIYRKEFSKENHGGLEDFLNDRKNLEKYEKWEGFPNVNSSEDRKDLEKYDKWVGLPSVDSRYIRISIPLKLDGGISIRRYSAKPKQPDYEHLTCNGQPVIPGSSWNGAFRSAARNILQIVGCKNTDALIDDWFGNTDHQSRIVFGESILRNSVAISITRNKINRIDASTVTGALYTEKAYFGGTTELEIMVRKSKNPENDTETSAIIGLLNLIIEDLCDGFVPVGGLVSVGRGIFEKNGDVSYSEDIGADCASALYGSVQWEA